jgi:hypothetical protein
VSETALDDFNFDYTIIAKSGDLDALKSKALGVLASVLKNHAAVSSSDSSNPVNCTDSGVTEVEYVSDIAFDDIFTSNAE